MENSLLDVEFPSLLPSVDDIGGPTSLSFWATPDSPTSSAATSSHASMALFNPDTMQAADFLDVPGSPIAGLQQPLNQNRSTSSIPHSVATSAFPPPSHPVSTIAVRPPRKTAAITYSDQDADQEDIKPTITSQSTARRRPKRIRPPPSAKRKARHQATESKRRERINVAVEKIRLLVNCDPRAEKAEVLERAAVKLAQLLNNANEAPASPDRPMTAADEEVNPNDMKVEPDLSATTTLDNGASRVPANIAMPDVTTVRLPTAFKLPLEEALRKTLVVSETSLCSPALQQALMLVSPSCHVVDCSPQFTTLLGRPKAEILGISAQTLLPDDDTMAVGGALIALFKGQLDNLTVVHRIGIAPNYTWTKCVNTRIDSSVSLQEIYHSPLMVGQPSTRAAVLVVVEPVLEPDNGAHILSSAAV
eukprot:m.74828 g.74828  ORF g.74828 m.74828 type:complete len:420 (+) comp14384_c0_seq1:296-1555(+)